MIPFLKLGSDPFSSPKRIPPAKHHRSCLESQSLVEGISSRLVLGSEALDSCFGAGASRLGGIVGTADVGELVADELCTFFFVSTGVVLSTFMYY